MPVLACALIASAACQSEEARPVDLTPLPTVANGSVVTGSYLCDYKGSDIPTPAKAVALMTGLDELDLSGFGYSNVCTITDDRRGRAREVLEIILWHPGAEWRDRIEEGVKGGGLPMPELAEGSLGVYWAGFPGGSFRGPRLGRANPDNEARAYLLLDNSELSIRLFHGAPGRDNAADVLALTKLLLPQFVAAVRPKHGRPYTLDRPKGKARR